MAEFNLLKIDHRQFPKQKQFMLTLHFDSF